MKTFRLLATSLLVALGMGVSSCGDEITKQDNTTYYDANGNVCTQKDFLKNLYN